MQKDSNWIWKQAAMKPLEGGWKLVEHRSEITRLEAIQDNSSV